MILFYVRSRLELEFFEFELLSSGSFTPLIQNGNGKTSNFKARPLISSLIGLPKTDPIQCNI